MYYMTPNNIIVDHVHLAASSLRSELVQKHIPGAQAVLAMIEREEDVFCSHSCLEDIIAADCVHFQRMAVLFTLPRCIRLGCACEGDVAALLSAKPGASTADLLHVEEQGSDLTEVSAGAMSRCFGDLIDYVRSSPPNQSADKLALLVFGCGQTLFAEKMFMTAEAKYFVVLRLLDCCSESVARDLRPACIVNIALTRLKRSWVSNSTPKSSCASSIKDCTWEGVLAASPLQLLLAVEASTARIYILRSLAYETLRRYDDAVACLDQATGLILPQNEREGSRSAADGSADLSQLRKRRNALQFKAARISTNRDTR